MDGLKVMLNCLLGTDKASEQLYKSIIGRTIVLAELIESSALRLTFKDGPTVEFYDDGQSCCERRYMVCGDDLALLAGATLMCVEVADGPTPPPSPDDYDDAHEVQFLRVYTSAGVVVCSNHNEHNGYYGGFSLALRTVEVH